MADKLTYYEILDVSRDSSEKEVCLASYDYFNGSY